MVKIFRDQNNSIITVELSEAERIRGREDFDFYCFLIWPFVEATWLGAVSLMALTPPTSLKGDVWIDMKQTQDMAQLVSEGEVTLVLSRLI